MSRATVLVAFQVEGTESPAELADALMDHLAEHWDRQAGAWYLEHDGHELRIFEAAAPTWGQRTEVPDAADPPSACPHCGSDESFHSIELLYGTCEVDQGEFVGYTNVDWDSSTTVGWVCRVCEYEFSPDLTEEDA